MEHAKRTLGIAYLIGAGLGLLVIQGVRLAVFEPITETTITITTTGLIAAGALVYAGYWLTTGSVADDRIWSIAKWGSLGLGVFVALDLLLIGLSADPQSNLAVGPGILIHNVTIGGVIGVLIGSTIEFKHAHDDTKRLHEHNAVLNRALRHNIRNEMNVLLGVLSRLETALDPEFHEEFALINKKGEKILKLGRQARLAEEARLGEQLEPIDARALLDRHVADLSQQYPTASIEVTGESEAWVEATDLLAIVFDTLLENAIEHHDRVQPIELHIEVTAVDDEQTHQVSIADNGPGIPDTERKAIDLDPDDPIHHSSGVGLWLANWIVEAFDGTLEFEQGAHRGTTAIITLNATAPPADAEGEWDPIETLG